MATTAPDGTSIEVLNDGKWEEGTEKPKGEKDHQGTGAAHGGKGRLDPVHTDAVVQENMNWILLDWLLFSSN